MFGKGTDMWVTCQSCKWVACFGGRTRPERFLLKCPDCGSLLSWKSFTKGETSNMIGYVDDSISFICVRKRVATIGSFMRAENRPDLSNLIGPDKNEIEYRRKNNDM